MRAGEDDLCRRSSADRCAPTPGATVTCCSTPPYVPSPTTGPTSPSTPSLNRLAPAAGTALLDAGGTAGTLRSEVAPNDGLLALSGVSLAAGESAQRQQAGRLLDLLVDGLRHRAAASAP